MKVVAVLFVALAAVSGRGQTMSEQKICAEQGEKVFKEMPAIIDTHGQAHSFITHYNAKQHACFVTLRENDFFYSEGGDVVSMLEILTVKNAFEGTTLGYCISQVAGAEHTVTVEHCTLGKTVCKNLFQFRGLAARAGYGSDEE
jgi:hypothetical protein